MNDVSLNIKICSFEDCNRKIKLSDYACKCTNFYCKFHISPNNHNCNYDYKKNINKQEIINNLLCKSNKIQKI